MDWQTIFTGIGAVVTGAGGCILVIAEFRRRDRRALKQEIDEMSADLSILREDLISCRRYAFDIAEELAAHGLDVPRPPHGAES